MAELDIKEWNIGAVTILDLAGKVTIGEGSVTLRNIIDRLLVEGKKKVVLNLSGVSYIDSSGGPELVSSWSKIHVAGGAMVFCNLTRKIYDLFSITKLTTVFDNFDSVENAVAVLATDAAYVSCPVYGCFGLSMLSGQMFERPTQCMKCRSSLRLRQVSAGSRRQVAVRCLFIPTYDREHIRITAGRPFVIGVKGRLDLFVSEAIEKAWRTVPLPRRIIFDLGGVDHVNETGVSKLLALCVEGAGGGMGVILARGKGEKVSFPSGALVYREKKEAAAALGAAESAHPWLLYVRPI